MWLMDLLRYLHWSFCAIANFYWIFFKCNNFEDFHKIRNLWKLAIAWKLVHLKKPFYTELQWGITNFRICRALFHAIPPCRYHILEFEIWNAKIFEKLLFWHSSCSIIFLHCSLRSWWNRERYALKAIFCFLLTKITTSWYLHTSLLLETHLCSSFW